MARVSTVVVPKPEFDALVAELARVREEADNLEADRDQLAFILKECQKEQARLRENKAAYEATAVENERLREENEALKGLAQAAPAHAAQQITTREFCQRCQQLSPVGFFSPKPMWQAVAGSWEHSILCITCFAALGDEKYLQWEQGLEFYPSSFATHRNALKETS